MLRGVTLQIIQRLEAEGALTPLTLPELEQALGSADNHTRAIRSLDLIRRIWLSDPGLGVPPVLDMVHEDEQDHVFYPGYRDHIVHSLQLYLLGLDIFHGQPAMRERLEQNGGADSFLRRWRVASLAHDHGYGAEVKDRFQIPGPLKNLLRDPLLAFEESISSGVRSGIGGHMVTRSWPSDFLEQLHEFEGDQLLDGIIDQCSPKSLGTGDNPLRDYYEFAKEQGPGGRDHGIVSVLLLLQLHHRLRDQLSGIQWDDVPSDRLTDKERAFLQRTEREMSHAAEDVEYACAAIALHNIRRDIWTPDQLKYATAHHKLRLSQFRIDFDETPLAWFLAFCDTLQCWNRPQVKGNASAVDRYHSEEQISLENGNNRVWIEFLDEEEHLRTSGESRYYRLRLDLVDYLDSPHVDALLHQGTMVSAVADPPHDLSNQVSSESNTLSFAQFPRLPQNWTILGTIEPESDRKAVQEKIERSRSLHPDHLPVCVLYTGGSVGMVPKDDKDPESPLVTKPVQYILPYLGRLPELPFDIHFWQTPEPLDSSNIMPENWHQMARDIQKLYPFYQGFVILHGTDTMTYTASALSYIFQDLGKPVILTGAERPIAQLVTDAVPNIMNALQLAAPAATGKPQVPEVTIYFGGKLIRGNRAKKTHSLAFAGFDSPNCELLGTVEDKIDIHTSVIRPGPVDRYGGRQVRELQLSVEELDPRVAMYEIYPSMDPCLDVLEYMLATSPQVRAVVLRTYGTGNAPTLPEHFLEVIEAGVKEHEKIVVNVTSCPAGQVEVRLFETNSRLHEVGVINGGDMTAEAAGTKLMWLLAKHSRNDGTIDRDAVAREMQVDLRGELRFSAYNLYQRDIELQFGVYSPKAQYIGEIDPDKVNRAHLGVHGVRLATNTPTDFALRLYFQSPEVTDDASTRFLHKRIGEISRRWEGTERERRDGITFNVDATQVVRSQLQPEASLSVQIVPVSPVPIEIDTVQLAIFTENRSRSA